MSDKKRPTRYTTEFRQSAVIIETAGVGVKHSSHAHLSAKIVGVEAKVL